MLLYAISLYADGNHKLIRWRIVVHGGIDGYTRMIVHLGCSTNNQATTVYRLFIAAAERFGLPSRVRSDFVGENILVARHMIRNKGIHRGSFITGSSTQDWETLGWYAPKCDILVLSFVLLFGAARKARSFEWNPPLFALHYVYVARLNHALKVFQDGWNHHGISTQNHFSPQQLFVQGALRLRLSGLVALAVSVLMIHQLWNRTLWLSRGSVSSATRGACWITR